RPRHLAPRAGDAGARMVRPARRSLPRRTSRTPAPERTQRPRHAGTGAERQRALEILAQALRLRRAAEVDRPGADADTRHRRTRSWPPVGAAQAAIAAVSAPPRRMDCRW